jgi:isovaleryl-CoA dehydrogenase
LVGAQRLPGEERRTPPHSTPPQKQNTTKNTHTLQELSRASGSVALSYGAHSNLCVNQIVRNGTPDQKARLLPRLLSGEAVGALAMSEPGAGSDVVSMRTKATRVDGGWRLDGTKMWCTNGTVAETLVVYAKTDPGTGAHGISAFLIEKGMPGFSPAQKLDKLGMRGSDTCELVLDGCVVPDENVLGEVNKGVYVMFSGLDYERLVLAGGPLGLAASALDVAIPYAATRVQGGKVIGDHQLVGGRLADMHVRTAAARALVMEAAAAADGPGWASPGERAAACAGAILFAAEAGTRTALDAIQVLGGNGYINDYPTGEVFFFLDEGFLFLLF